MSWYCCGSSLQRTNSKVRRPPSDSTLLPATNSQLDESLPSNTAERTSDDSAPTRKIHEFSYQQLLDATQRFNKESIVDVRSVGSVYHGKLRDTGEAQKKIKKPKKFPELADPLLQGNFPANGFNQALALVVKCLQLQESTRPVDYNTLVAVQDSYPTPH
uniref:Uncharacterized protein n=1 Tax=Chenopodium quinoa TaxID=63459 RepID=A0A803LAL2_CHEQI